MAAYSIILHTGPGDGDQVYLTLFGTKASSHEVAVGQAAKATDGHPARHEGELVNLGEIDLGDIKRVRVRHDHPGVGPGCYLDRVVVRAAGTLHEWTFLYQRWLVRHGRDGVTERTLDVRLA